VEREQALGSYHADSGPRTRICVVDRDGASALSYAAVGADGAPGVAHALTATVTRPDPRSLSAVFTPLAAGLPLGSIAWQAQSTWTDHGACAAPTPCVDDVPDHAPALGRISLLAEPRCFGAASRDPLHPCQNPALALAVVPTPADALITPNAFCRPTQRADLVSVCAFGATTSEASATIALVGDSHAEHWRGAMEVVAQARHWRGLSITRASCPFTQAQPVLADATLTANCGRWNAELERWFRRHPQIHTVFVSADAVTHFAGSAKPGFQAAWAGLPASVRKIVVIHDTPQIVSPQAGCVDDAIAHHEPAGVRCAQPRSADLPSDPDADAAYDLDSPRVRVVDLTHYMCDARICFAVVGGALVRKDGTHMTSVFSSTLGPYLLRSIDRIVPPAP
jgi:hypothetical protein